jgi:hypothetical protein
LAGFGGDVEGSLVVLAEETELLTDAETAFEEVLVVTLELN